MYAKLRLEEFKDILEQSENPIVVKFYSEYSGICQMMFPFFKELMNEYKESHEFLLVDGSTSVELVSFFKIYNYPTILFFKKGKLLYRLDGSTSRTTIVKQLDDLKKAV